LLGVHYPWVLVSLAQPFHCCSGKSFLEIQHRALPRKIALCSLPLGTSFAPSYWLMALTWVVAWLALLNT
jgi:hypothetical protein